MNAPVEPLEGEKLMRDVFPAEVLFPNGAFATRVRACITSHRLLIFRWTGEIDVEEYPLLASVPKDKSITAIRERLEVQVDEGPVFVNRALGCRCGALGHMGVQIPW